MVESTTRETQTGADIRDLKVGKLFDDLFRREARGEQVEDIDDANAHAADARPSPTLVGIHRDAIHEFDCIAHRGLGVEHVL